MFLLLLLCCLLFMFDKEKLFILDFIGRHQFDKK